MKRSFLAFLIILMSVFIGVVKAENIFINEISLVEKSDDVVVNKEPVKNGLKMDFDLKFKNVGDFIKYKVLVLNKDSEDYTLSSSDKSDNGYIKYEYVYENDNKVVVAGGEKIMYVIITYNKEIPEELFKDGKYNETHSTNLVFYNNRLPMEEMKKVENPRTSSASIVLISLAVILSLVISFLLSSRKMRRYLGVFIIGSLLISPFIVYAINSLFITVNVKIEIEKEYKVCFYDVDVNTYSEENYTYGEKISKFTENYNINGFASTSVINCYKDYYSNYDSSTEEGIQKKGECRTLLTNEVDNNVSGFDIESFIRGIKEGCYVSVES